MTIGQSIKAKRKELHMTQEELAEKLEVSRQAVSKWEADQSVPAKRKRERLEELMHFQIQEAVFEVHETNTERGSVEKENSVVTHSSPTWYQQAIKVVLVIGVFIAIFIIAVIILGILPNGSGRRQETVSAEVKQVTGVSGTASDGQGVSDQELSAGAGTDATMEARLAELQAQYSQIVMDKKYLYDGGVQNTTIAGLEEAVSEEDQIYWEEQYGDVLKTIVTYVVENELCDGVNPDTALETTSGHQISHRQQAFLALQELYLLTGVKLDRVYVTANEYGVFFSLADDNMNECCFYSLFLPEEYGGQGIGSLYLTYHEENKHSPIYAAESEVAASADSSVKADQNGSAEESLAVRYYERLHIFKTGDIVRTEKWADGETIRLYMTDGSFYEVLLTKPVSGAMFLCDLHGPYEAGFEH